MKKKERVDLDEILGNEYERTIQYINHHISEYNEFNNDYDLRNIIEKILPLLQKYIKANIKIQINVNMSVKQFKELCNLLLLPKYKKNIEDLFNKINNGTINNNIHINKDQKIEVVINLNRLWREGLIYQWVYEFYKYIVLNFFINPNNTTMAELLKTLKFFVNNHSDQKLLSQFSKKVSKANERTSIKDVLIKKIEKYNNNHYRFDVHYFLETCKSEISDFQPVFK